MQTTRTRESRNASELLPVRGSGAVEILINDHKVIKRLLQELTKARDKSKRTTVLEQLKGVLTIHNATEENLVYPALAIVAKKKMKANHLYHETAEADMVVFQLDTMLKESDDEKFPALAEKLQEAVLEHIDDEENDAFQELKEHSDPQHATLLTQAVREFRSQIDVQARA